MTIASGKSSHAEGLGTSDKRLVAEGDFSHAEGACTYAKGSASHAEGYNTVAEGGNSHAEGRDTQAKNGQEHAEGRFNLSHKGSDSWGNAGNTVHSIGIGNSEANRMNAVEVMQDGKVYVKGVGNYDGKNPTESTTQDLATVINNISLIKNTLSGQTFDMTSNTDVQRALGAIITALGGIATNVPTT